MSENARIYLMAPRKQWHHELDSSWREVAWERFDYVECGIYEKPESALTEEDRGLVEAYDEPPEGWIEPAPPF